MRPNETLDRMTRSVIGRVFQFVRPWRAPRHRSALRWADKRAGGSVSAGRVDQFRAATAGGNAWHLWFYQTDGSLWIGGSEQVYRYSRQGTMLGRSGEAPSHQKYVAVVPGNGQSKEQDAPATKP